MNTTAPKKRELSKRGKKPSTYRRIVTGNVNGKSVVQSDDYDAFHVYVPPLN